MSKTFEELGLSFDRIKAIERKGFEEPTQIQKKIIPLILEGKRDLLVQSQTGTGKTAAFAIPLIEKLTEKKHNQLLVIVPTRELAIQLSEEIHSLCGRKRLKTVLLYGGQSFDSQAKRLRQGAEIVIGTPGRILDHINNKTYKTVKIDYLVIDEVDKIMMSGFYDDIEEILKYSNRNRKTYFFSATIPDKIGSLAKIYTKKLDKIIATKTKINSKLTKQIYLEVLSHDKFQALTKILDFESDFYGIIFCKSRLKAKHLGKRLANLGYMADGIHGDLPQDIREQVIGKFRNKKISILTATDVAARGLDIPNLTHIINYSLPQDTDSYIHRIGRTGRAGKEGIAITFITPEENRKLFHIKKTLKQDIHRREIEEFEIKEKKKNLSESLDKTNTSRLFISLGSKNNMTKPKLVDFIYKNTGIPTERLFKIIVAETYSFVTTSFEDAEKILEVFKGRKNGKRKMVELAKSKTKK